MNSARIYDNLIKRARARDKVEEYTEKHHVVPRCLGGRDTTDNLVVLLAKEHFMAHWLLLRIYPNHKGISFAFFCMGHQKRSDQCRYVNSRGYVEAKRRYNINFSGENHHRAMLGKHHTDKWKRDASARNKGKNNPVYGKHYKWSEEKREKARGRCSGEKNGNAKLTNIQRDSIPYEYAGGSTKEELFKKYGVHITTINRVLKKFKEKKSQEVSK